MHQIVSRGMQVLIPPDSRNRKGDRAGWTGGSTHGCAVLANEPGHGLYQDARG